MKRRFFVPEVVQTSAMDCGPASLKALLEGFGVSASYGRLREACQTDVDGTSIDRIEEAAVQLGLDAEQVMVPIDHLLLPSANLLPALVVVRQPNGATHFVIAWRRHGRWLQCMDPATGRRWTTCEHFLSEVYRHTQSVPSEAWREWAGTESFLAPLRERGASSSQIETALADPGWRALAALDAATRMASALERGGAIDRRSAGAFIGRLAADPDKIPPSYWSASPDPSSAGSLLMTGAVLLQARAAGKATTSLPPDLAAALSEPPSRPGRDLLRLLRDDGVAAPLTLVAALALGAGSVAFEAVLFRSIFEVGRQLVLNAQRLAAIGALVAFVACLLVLDTGLAVGVLRMGRRLDCRLRLKFLEKIPRLGDSYSRSRLSSDMAERSHSAHRLRMVPELASRFLRPLCEMAFTVTAIAWLYPRSAPWAALLAAISLAIPLLAQPLLAERDLRLRSHAGALSRFYLDALLGLVAIRAHGAERSIRREQETMLAQWANAALGYQRAVTAMDGVQFAAGVAMVALVLRSLGRGSGPPVCCCWSTGPSTCPCSARKPRPSRGSIRASAIPCCG